MSDDIIMDIPEPIERTETNEPPPLWTGQDMVDAMDARPVNGVPARVTGISIDSRTLRAGDAFFAIKGDNLDGHDYATAAAAAGASVLVIAESKLPALGRLTVPMMVVSDVLDALVRLGEAARARTKATVIAVTGSVGKTTTKEALRHVLESSGRVHASAASFNNHWGVPLTLARMPQDSRFGVFEIGMNHPDEIRPLVKQVRPHIAMVTAVAPAHLGFFSSVEEIAKAKAEIFEGVIQGGYALINRDDAQFGLLEKLARKANVDHIIGFGENENAAIRLLEVKQHEDGSGIVVRVFDEEIAANVGVPGRHVVQNVLAVLGAAQIAGADMAQVTNALASLTAGKGRGERHHLKVGSGSFTLIDESYNANPASVEAALELLSTAEVSQGGRRIAVLGDMLELGSHSHELHAKLVEPIGRAGVDRLYLAGPEIKALADAMPDSVSCEYRETGEELAGVLADVPQPGDVIMIKSSNGIGFSRIVKAMQDKYARAGNDAVQVAP